MRKDFVAMAALALCASGCAEKEFTPPTSALSPKITLQLSTTAPAQPTGGAAWVLVAAVYQTPSDSTQFELLGYKFVPISLGAVSVSLPVDISPCLAANASRGKDGCSLYVAAALLPDTTAVSDSTRNPLGEAFDSAFPVGPFEVAPGHSPTIPPIDLSMTRFGVVTWSGDEALRLGGSNTPVYTAVGILGNVAPLSGVASASGAPTLFGLTRGFNYTNTNSPQQFQQAYPQLGIYQGGAWRRVSGPNMNPVFGTNDYNDVTALSLNEVYMSSTTGLFKFDGTAIARITTISDTLYSVASAITSTSAKYVIAGGNNGAVWIGDTQTWQRSTVPSTNRIDGVCITGPSEAFASSQQGGLFRFNGTSWSSVPTALGGAKVDLQCPAPGQAYVIAGSTSLYRWTGTTWAALPTTSLSVNRQYRWSVVSPTEIYAYGDSAATDRAWYRFDGTSWNALGRLRFTSGGGRP